MISGNVEREKTWLRGLVIAGFAIVGLSWLAWYMQVRVAEPAGAQSTQVGAEADANDGSQHPRAQVVTQRIGVASPSVALLRVESLEGEAPLAGAGVSLVTRAANNYSIDALDPVGVTDKLGKVKLTLGQQSTFVVSLSGYLSANVEMDAGQEKTVRLVRGGRLAVSVVDALGHAIPGARVVCYGAGADARLVSGEGARQFELSVFAEESNCISGEADSEGRVTLCVPGGMFSVGAYSQGMFMVDPPRSISASLGQEQAVKVVMAPLLGCIIAMPANRNGQLLAQQLRVVGRSWGISTSLFANRVAHAEEKRLQVENPGSVCIVRACLSSNSGERSPILSANLLIAGHGWVREEVPFVPLPVSGIHYVRASSKPDKLGVLELKYEGNLSTRVVRELLVIQAVSHRGQPIVRVPLNEPVSVPVGTYALSSSAGGRLAKVAVRESGKAILRVDDELLGSVVTLAASVGGNSSPWGIRIVLEPLKKDGGRKYDLMPLDPGSFRLLMAPGEYQVSADWRGKKLPPKRVVVESGQHPLQLNWSAR